ncbi:VOC family protein [Roseobacter sinensis]|uniref:VOC family protein n=1 Tax=Roseobacter sinensis TaxID=2931391 RepID=A0ABT3BH89_9RHOB|nr:VOC family protein [Roseobacter sp. WL0113]MCV3272950.1 VOC family protein [Roseobacter sp. WL0113]
MPDFTPADGTGAEMRLDHLAVAGETLEQAQARVEEALGVPMQPGGEHAVFHTHNALLGLEDGLYLEAIAVNPAAPAPERARWFDLDRFRGSARLTNWICQVSDLPMALGDLPAGMGQPVALRRAALRWRMAVPESGGLPFDNCAPALIQWDTPIHPAQMLEPRGVRLRRLTVQHPEADALRALFGSRLQDDRLYFDAGAPALVADFETPHGPRTLSS